MATNPLVPLVSAFDVTTSFSTAYTVPAGKIRVGIDAVVFNNYSNNSVTFSVRLVQVTDVGSETVLNEVISDKDIRSSDNDLAPAMIGQSLATNGQIQVKASANSAVSLTITGTEVIE